MKKFRLALVILSVLGFVGLWYSKAGTSHPGILEGRWVSAQQHESCYYEFDYDNKFRFVTSDHLSLNTIEEFTGRYEYTDTTIIFYPEQYLEKPYESLAYDEVNKNWMFKTDRVEWKTLDSVVVSVREFSISGDTAYIDRLTYIRVSI